MPVLEPTEEDLRRIRLHGKSAEGDGDAATRTWARIAVLIGAEGADMVFSLSASEAVNRIEAVEQAHAALRAEELSDMYDALGAVFAGKKGATELKKKIDELSR